MDEITEFVLGGYRDNLAAHSRTATEVAILQEREERRASVEAQAAITAIEARGADAERARIRLALLEAFARKEFDHWRDAADVKKIAERVCDGAAADAALAALLGDR